MKVVSVQVFGHLQVMEKRRKKPVLVVLSGAGISRESGIQTFRDSGGLWEGYDVMEVATPEAWASNPSKVLDFYNKRRVQLAGVEPNAAHHALAELEADFEVHVVTQNVDDLHERAGSVRVLHLHGQLRQVRPEDDLGLDDSGAITVGSNEVPGPEVALGDVDARGVQLRPHVVWFGEAVPMMGPASAIVAKADAVLVVGTSMQVYPAAGLMEFAPANAPLYMVNPDRDAAQGCGKSLTEFYHVPASEGVPLWALEMRRQFP